MKKLNAFYFSGTGNTKYVTERLCEKLSQKFNTASYDIAQGGDFSALLKEADCIMLAFPVYGSSPPKPMRQFIYQYSRYFNGREAIIIATQYMFSGDGAASLGRTVQKFGGKVNYAEHFDMPNNLSDCKMFAIRNGSELEKTLQKAEKKMDKFVKRIEEGRPFRRGFNLLSHGVGYFCQRKFWRLGEDLKRSNLRVDPKRCIGCGLCAKKCPSKNIVVTNGLARPQGNCIFCYRCVNICPKQAITLFGKAAPEMQYKGITAGKKS